MPRREQPVDPLHKLTVGPLSLRSSLYIALYLTPRRAAPWADKFLRVSTMCTERWGSQGRVITGQINTSLACHDCDNHAAEMTPLGTARGTPRNTEVQILKLPSGFEDVLKESCKDALRSGARQGINDLIRDRGNRNPKIIGQRHCWGIGLGRRHLQQALTPLGGQFSV